MTELEQYIEEMGLFYEKLGLTRMAGRILGFLMASDIELLSFDDIVQQLRASKGSISGNINFLLKNQLIEKVMVTGDRKSYYRYSSIDISKEIEEKIITSRLTREMFEKALAINGNPQSAKHQNISELIDFYHFLELELANIGMKWVQERTQSKGAET